MSKKSHSTSGCQRGRAAAVTACFTIAPEHRGSSFASTALEAAVTQATEDRIPWSSPGGCSCSQLEVEYRGFSLQPPNLA